MKKVGKRLLESIRPLVFGMVHVPALPGSPLNKLKINEISQKVIAETQLYARTRVDGLIFENMHDLPYSLANNLGPETSTAMTRVCLDAIRTLGEQRKDLLLGVQILAGGNREALAVAQAAELDFIRAECFVFAHVADEGLMNGCAGQLLRYRRGIGADVEIFVDIKKKHCSHSITSDVSISETAHAAEFFQADGLIVTGTSTGKAAELNDLRDTRKATQLPVLVGSGITAQNFCDYLQAHAFIVGSYFKKEGKWNGELDESKIRNFTSLVRGKKRE